MNMNALSKFGALALVGATALLSVSQLLAEERPDVLKRIAPVGQVNVEGAAKATPAPAETAPAAAEQKAAEAAPAEAAPAEAPAAAPAAAPAPAAAASGGDVKALAQASGCLACHQIDVKVVGPAYKDVAAKYKGDAGAEDMLVEKVKKGGSGTWGPIPMPPNSPNVSDENIRKLVEWILSL